MRQFLDLRKMSSAVEELFQDAMDGEWTAGFINSKGKSRSKAHSINEVCASGVDGV